MHFNDIKDNLVYYYPKNLTFFGLDIFKYQKPPYLSQEQVHHVIQNASNEQKEELIKAYDAGDKTAKMSKFVFPTMVALFLTGIMTNRSKQRSTKGFLYALPILVGNTAWVFHESWWGNTYSRYIRPVIDKAYNDVSNIF